MNLIALKEEDYKDAKKVAECLGIEIRRVDFIKEYWDHVFTYFIDEYKSGRTRIQIFYVINILNLKRF